MEKLTQCLFEGERALYNSKELEIYDSTFANGESPLKECKSINIYNSIFKWKYPIWYSEDINVKDSTFLITARSGIWYTRNITLENCTVDAPKTFRRCDGVNISSCTFPNAEEMLWNSKRIVIDNASASGDYFGMNSEDIKVNNFSISGNYLFDGGKNIEVSNAKLISKDAFWNCENVTVRDSVIIGEYLGWNSKNVKFINCTIESNQGLCYMDGVVLENCKLHNTDLAFEFSHVEADVISKIDSVKNPLSGNIKAKDIGELILDEALIDKTKTNIVMTSTK